MVVEGAGVKGERWRTSNVKRLTFNIERRPFSVGCLTFDVECLPSKFDQDILCKYSIDSSESPKWILEEGYDLEERLLLFSASIITLTDGMLKSRAGNHVAAQLLRSGTSPFPNHGEAQAAESLKDFIHKLKVCLKELRETWRWLRLVDKVPLAEDVVAVKELIRESDELIRIFSASIRTAEKRKG